MKTSKNIEPLHNTIDKLKLSETTPQDVQEHIRKNKGKAFNKTLKKAGGYGILFGLISKVFFTLRRYGFNITIIKSAIILSVTAIIAISAVTAGLYVTIRFYSSPESTINIEFPNDTSVEMNLSKKEISVKKEEALSASVISRRIGIRGFRGNNVPTSDAVTISDEIAKKLIQFKGPGSVINLNRNRQSKVGMMLLGSVEHVNDEYIISARVVRVRDAKILTYTREKFSSFEDYEKICQRIALRIVNSLQ